MHTVAVIGYGRMGLIHARNAMENPKLSLKYIVGTNAEAVQAAAASFPGVQATTDLSAVLDDAEITGVIICSPTDAHYGHIESVGLLNGETGGFSD